MGKGCIGHLPGDNKDKIKKGTMKKENPEAVSAKVQVLSITSGLKFQSWVGLVPETARSQILFGRRGETSKKSRWFRVHCLHTYLCIYTGRSNVLDVLMLCVAEAGIGDLLPVNGDNMNPSVPLPNVVSATQLRSRDNPDLWRVDRQDSGAPMYIRTGGTCSKMMS